MVDQNSLNELYEALRVIFYACQSDEKYFISLLFLWKFGIVENFKEFVL